MNIDSIRWSSDGLEADRQLIRFMLLVLNELDIRFRDGPRPDPMIVADAYLDGEVTEETYAKHREVWSSYVESFGYRDFKSPEAVVARLGLCLFRKDGDNGPPRGEVLSWFLELLWMAGVDTKVALEQMRTYFSFAK